MKEVSSGTEEWYFAQPPRSCLRMHEDALVACGKKKTFCYLASEDKWYEMADMLFEKRLPTATSACHGKMYIIGRNGVGEESTMDRYDPSGNSWTPVSSYNGTISRNFAAVVNFQGFLYVIGGKNENGEINSVHKYNPDTNLWQEVVPLNVARCCVCAVADKNFLYVIGGKADVKCLDVVERFEPERNTWSMLASTVERKLLSCGVAVRDNLFIFGGFTSSELSTSTSLIEMYNPALNMWMGVQNMATPKYPLSAVSFKGNMFLIGLWTQDGFPSCCLKVYDADKNEWKPCVSIPHGFHLSSLAPLRIPRDILLKCKDLL